MSKKLLKNIGDFCKRIPKEIRKDLVVNNILNKYFEGKWEQVNGTHIVVTDDRLLGFQHPEIINGTFTVVAAHGRIVRFKYLYRLCKILKYLEFY